MKKRKPKTARRAGLSFQEVVFALSRFWAGQACVIQQPYDLEVGAGTMHPETFFRVLGPDPYRVAYVQPSRRPSDGRYGDNPNRLYKHIQFQVILKPAPAHVQEVYLASLEALGIDRRRHDIRFEEDNWEAPTLGAWGIGWQVMLDGLEITQFTYFQQCGGLDLDPVSVELTYGLERIAAFLQGVGNVFDLAWNDARRYGELRLEEERQASAYGFEWADVEACRRLFELSEQEARRLLEAYPKDAPVEARQRFPVLPAYDLCLKCSHLFNLLDARGAISTTERAALIGRIRGLACRAAALYLHQKYGREPGR
ncbi:MAG: glycine--tRNA ligase subunit alpha [Acidobacteria bacterium RIFCSPHIGHO2_12_FULL_67_30]|nr:MAG: glycine--tRNA ligase subunit alpha [Acidobacteria bacterium RIFCSPHIGHO2_02_FULL_67_57]OFV85965.1 MAG: glycine--tRNA ligase subunit alpha [Acidobacteria bacterium RIFCSPHIGHO2_01_FULL_67_28]OFV86750.1 MAG: glycine--tRNA ligase subunit alpha [Acidobacteria bacterium RIFCSPHIGHO2_12_FULL_67_30]